MAAKSNSDGPSSELKLRIVRVFAAPRALVFDAWTKPEQIKQWSAPRGFTIPVSEGDLKVGGKWRACMISPQGEELWLGGEYREIVPNERLVFTHAWGEDEGKPRTETIVTVQFADHPDGTEMIFEQTGFASIESRDGHSGGWNECLELLADHLAKSSEK